MEALFISSFAKRLITVGVGLSMVFLGFPEAALASTLQSAEENPALVFEVKNLNIDPANTQKSLSYNEVVVNDPLAVKLKAYLEAHKSPLAEFAPEIIQQPQWERSLSISWVESNFGRFCANNNCSGIGVAPGHPAWRKYPNKLEWFKDMCQLMETPRYKEKYVTFRQMKGIYVYPGSERWVRGAEQKYAELQTLKKEAMDERAALHQQVVVAAGNSNSVEITTNLE